MYSKRNIDPANISILTLLLPQKDRLFHSLKIYRAAHRSAPMRYSPIVLFTKYG